MRQGTTPTHTFNVDIDTSTIAKLNITYAQHGNVVLSKKAANCSITQGAIQVSLTQQETLKFRAGTKTDIQLHILTTDGEALVSDVYSVPVDILLSKEVLK